MDFEQLATYAYEQKASDIHLSPNLPPMVRVHGEIKEVRVPVMNAVNIKEMLHGIMTEQQRGVFEEDLEIDFSVAVNPQIRFRVNAFQSLNGPSAVFRLIPTIIKSLQDLQCPSIFQTFTHYDRGMILVTGPTGSGKSTTLAGIIDYINENMHKHVITIEDPIEFIHKSKKSLINQREVGANTRSFTRALKSALREDPDVVLVGELRDLESISLALTAAETGHLVLATLHTSSAAKTIDRIVDVFPADNKEMIRTMLASSLKAVIAQKLLKRADGQGRVAAYEILVVTDAIANLIRENKVAQINSLIQVSGSKGMITMQEYIETLMQNGTISPAEAKEALFKSGVDEVKTTTSGSAPSKSAASVESDF